MSIRKLFNREGERLKEGLLRANDVKVTKKRAKGIIRKRNSSIIGACDTRRKLKKGSRTGNSPEGNPPCFCRASRTMMKVNNIAASAGIVSRLLLQGEERSFDMKPTNLL
ncbi:MAG: hypothetical protein V3T10_01675 [Candidatus Bathyarchaeia archaeon]